MNANDTQYAVEYVRKALSSYALEAPDRSRVNGLFEPLAALYDAHQIGQTDGNRGPEVARSAWHTTVKKAAPELAALVDTLDKWKSYSPAEYIEAHPPVSYCDPDRIVQAGELTAVVAQPGVGKSFWMLAKAAQLAETGVKTLIVAAEGLNPDRILALEKQRQTEGKKPLGATLQITTTPIDLTNDFDVAAFVQAFQPFNPDVVFIDTFGACTPNLDENTSQDTQPVMNRIREQIIKGLGCAVVLLHHTTKDGKGFRGSNAIRGSVTNMYMLIEEDGQIVLKSDKQRDAERDTDRYYNLISFDTRLHPETGEQLSSAVMLPSEKVVNDPSVSLSRNQRKVLEALDGFTQGMRYTALEASTGLQKSSLLSAIKRLIKAGLVNQSEQGEPYYITQKGIEVLCNQI